MSMAEILVPTMTASERLLAQGVVLSHSVRRTLLGLQSQPLQPIVMAAWQEWPVHVPAFTLPHRHQHNLWPPVRCRDLYLRIPND